MLQHIQDMDTERDDTTYLLSSPTMRERLMQSLQSNECMGWDEVKDALGI